MPRRRPLRQDLTLAYANAGVWALGNGMVSTTLVTYLAIALGARGLAVGMILAAPRFAGVLRVFAPVMLARLKQRKALCIGLLAASAAVLIVMPPLVLPWTNHSSGVNAGGIWVLVITWSLYHLLEYTGVVLLWSWLGDLMPPRVRGELIGRRERWLVVGRVIGIALSLGLTVVWGLARPEDSRTVALAASAMIGALLLLLSTLPLVGMSPREATPKAPQRSPWRAMSDSLANGPYRRLLVYSVGLSIANGVTSVAIALYQTRVLNFDYPAMVGLRSVMYGGQAAVAPAAGRWLDRHGARGLMVAAQLIVATGPLFYWLATPGSRWWIAGAYLAWVAYAATNVGLDHLKLKLAPPGEAAPALAVYHAASDLGVGVMTVVGGAVYDALSGRGEDPLTLYAALFIGGWLARTAVAGLAARLAEPA